MTHMKSQYFLPNIVPRSLLNTLHLLLYHQGFMPCPLRQFVPLTDPLQLFFISKTPITPSTASIFRFTDKN